MPVALVDGDAGIKVVAPMAKSLHCRRNPISSAMPSPVSIASVQRVKRSVDADLTTSRTIRSGSGTR
jgi:hypothetical protein